VTAGCIQCHEFIFLPPPSVLPLLFYSLSACSDIFIASLCFFPAFVSLLAHPPHCSNVPAALSARPVACRHAGIADVTSLQASRGPRFQLGEGSLGRVRQALRYNPEDGGRESLRYLVLRRHCHTPTADSFRSHSAFTLLKTSFVRKRLWPILRLNRAV
jgi:hypothetical protein